MIEAAVSENGDANRGDYYVGTTGQFTDVEQQFPPTNHSAQNVT